MNAEEYATHTIGMFLDGNYTGEDTYRRVLEIATECESAYGTGAAYKLAGELREFVEVSIGDEFWTDATIAADLVGFMLSSADWNQLASDKLTEVGES